MADEIMTTEEQELFQLSNGRYIMDKDQSRKMFYIKEAKPERSLTETLKKNAGATRSAAPAIPGTSLVWQSCFPSATRMIPAFARKQSAGTPILREHGGRILAPCW